MVVLFVCYITGKWGNAHRYFVWQDQPTLPILFASHIKQLHLGLTTSKFSDDDAIYDQTFPCVTKLVLEVRIERRYIYIYPFFIKPTELGVKAL